MPVEIDSPIVPGEGAASIKLGETVTDILRGTAEDFVFEREYVAGMGHVGVMRYRSRCVDFWVKDDIVWQVMVHDSYTGKMDGKIGLGSTLADVEKHLGPVVVIDDNLAVKGVPGISFEPQTDSDDSPIIGIYVWMPDWVELRDHHTP